MACFVRPSQGRCLQNELARHGCTAGHFHVREAFAEAGICLLLTTRAREGIAGSPRRYFVHPVVPKGAFPV